MSIFSFNLKFDLQQAEHKIKANNIESSYLTRDIKTRKVLFRKRRQEQIQWQRKQQEKEFPIGNQDLKQELNKTFRQRIILNRQNSDKYQQVFQDGQMQTQTFGDLIDKIREKVEKKYGISSKRGQKGRSPTFKHLYPYSNQQQAKIRIKRQQFNL